VARNCIHCGKALPRDDARFCPNCGAPVAPRELGAQPSSPQDRATPPHAAISQPERKKPALREQVAQQPPARSTQRGQGVAGAKKTSEFGEEGQPDQPPVEWPTPVTHVTAADPSTHRSVPADDTVRQDFPASEQKPRPEAPARALHVNVWEPEEPPEGEAAKVTAIEDLPTREVAVAAAERPGILPGRSCSYREPAR
jgi:hypothetical protein